MPEQRPLQQAHDSSCDLTIHTAYLRRQGCSFQTAFGGIKSADAYLVMHLNIVRAYGSLVQARYVNDEKVTLHPILCML